VHLDLKPENIVIAKNYYLKVIDFAESIIINDPNHIYMQRGHTMPYTAPDILKAQHILAVGTESDVFSFAHIIYTVLTRKRLTGHKRTSNNKLSHKYKNDTFKSAPLPDELKYMGPKYLMKYIYPTIMMCFASNPSSRLPPEQAVSIFYELMTLSEKMF
jgi:serine/threonine protein kinase